MFNFAISYIVFGFAFWDSAKWEKGFVGKGWPKTKFSLADPAISSSSPTLTPVMITSQENLQTLLHLEIQTVIDVPLC